MDLGNKAERRSECLCIFLRFNGIRGTSLRRHEPLHVALNFKWKMPQITKQSECVGLQELKKGSIVL
jgi:hypothetical protein